MQLVELALFTPEFERVAAFYETLLGGPPARGEGIAIFSTGQVKLLIHRQGPGEPGGPPDVDHFAFGVADVDEHCRQMQAMGVELLIPPRDYDWGRSAYLRDPEGRLVELHQVGGRDTPSP